MAKALKAKGFNFCGPVIVYAFMQAVGMVNDHLPTVSAMARSRVWPMRRPGRTCGWSGTVPRPVCGVDEAGRGPWAGPVCAAAVILAPRARIAGLDDSKKPDGPQREALEPQIKARALAWAVAFATVEEIGELNILQATGLAMRRAVEALTPRPRLRPGGRQLRLRPAVPGEDGDRRRRVSASIAAASILAKTARDRLMARWTEPTPATASPTTRATAPPPTPAPWRRLAPAISTA